MAERTLRTAEIKDRKFDSRPQGCRAAAAASGQQAVSDRGHERKLPSAEAMASCALKSTGCRRKGRVSDGSSAERAIGFLT
jgi:hypothetical protein